MVRIDALLTDWPAAAAHLRRLGYGVGELTDDETIDCIASFIEDWIGRTNAVYVAASLPPTWRYPTNTPADRIIDDALLPALAEAGLPLALMIGVERGVNPKLGPAGDGVGVADVASLCSLAERAGDTRLLVTMLSDQNQHELCVAARKFANITPFGCWWFLNTPTSIDHMTRLRLELLGTTFIPQHSDARVLEQIIYKWHHSRDVIARALGDHLASVEAAGRTLTDDEIVTEVNRLLYANYEQTLRNGESVQ